MFDTDGSDSHRMSLDCGSEPFDQDRDNSGLPYGDNFSGLLL
jgi:hypothetical protein